ncbi:protein FAM151B-like [Ptychodera flava]|uniref:protein FAM151B-like n=1 Tax=Ptychodera flava TaxID=63121 RepID=UPI00396A3F4D
MAEVFHTLGDVDGLDVTWAHAVNSTDKLNEALQSYCDLLEADVLLDKSGIPIMTHLPAKDSDNTLDTWLDRILKTNKGIKLDFKDTASLESSLKVLTNYKDQLSSNRRPLWLTSDIVKGPTADCEPVNATKFVSVCCENFPSATLSVGWRYKWDISTQDQIYTWQMIFDILKYVNNLPQDITFAVCAAWLTTSLEQFLWLLGVKNSFSLTIWSHSHHRVDMQALVYLRNHVDKRRIFYDLPQTHMQELLHAIKNSTYCGALFPQRMKNFDKGMWEIIYSEKNVDHVYISSEGIAGTSTSENCILKSKGALSLSKQHMFSVCGIGKFLNIDAVPREDSCLVLNICSSGETNMEIYDGVKVSVNNHGYYTLSN